MFENSRMLSILQSTWSDTAGILKEFKKTFGDRSVLKLKLLTGKITDEIRHVR